MYLPSNLLKTSGRCLRSLYKTSIGGSELQIPSALQESKNTQMILQIQLSTCIHALFTFDRGTTNILTTVVGQ